MKKCLAGLIFAAILFVSIYPLQSYAATMISKIDIELADPVKGATPDYSPQLPSNANYTIESLEWYEVVDGEEGYDYILLKETDTFTGDNQVKASFELKAKNGYEFIDFFQGLSIHIDGEGTVYGDEAYGTYVTFSVFYYNVKDPYAITSAAIQITPPAAGETPDYYPVLPSDSYLFCDNSYPDETSINSVSWFDDTAERWMDTTDTFIAGHIYSFRSKLKPWAGYEISTQIYATVNGNYATAELCDSIDGDYLRVIFTFPVIPTSKPTITGQPESVSIAEGDMAFFYVTATDVESYQWQYRNSSGGSWTTVKNNGKSHVYSLVTEARHNGYQYRCKVTNSFGSVYSKVVTLTVETKPVITTQPKSVSVAEGKTATFTVAAIGGGLSYQWCYRKTSADSWTTVKNNGTSATYSLTTEARHNGYQYRCKVKNKAGSVYSSTVTLTVQTKPAISTQPTSVSVAEGKTATFTVAATGGGLSYQWQYRTSSSGSWTNVKNNGTSATYNLTTEARHNGYQYRCKITNKAGTVYSSIVKLTVQTKPVITSQPSSATVNEGKTATFKVTATGGGLSYQWQYRKSSAGSWTTVKNNGTSATYSLTTEARHNGYQYRCRVTNKAGSATSKTVTLTVVAKPVITGQPSSVTVTKGKTATFKVTATGATSYQWQYRTSSSGSWTDVKNNGTSATYLLKTEARHNGYQYRCKVTNSAGSVYTKVVTLTVK